MPSLSHRIFFVALLALTVTGCAELQPTNKEVPTSSVTAIVTPPAQAKKVFTVDRPPPNDLTETMPPVPGPAELWAWQRGHWHWTGSAYSWEPGRWAKRPGYNAEWLAPHWDPYPDGGWVFVKGSWR